MSTEDSTKEVKKTIVNYLTGLLVIFLLAEIGLTWRFTVLLYYYLSYGIIALLLPIMAAPILLILYLEKHPNPTYKKIGKVFSVVFGCTALAQAIFYITLVFMILGGTIIQSPDFSSTTRFMFEWIMGSMYASFIVYGLSGLMLVTMKQNLIGYFLSACILIYGWSGLVLVLEFEEAFSKWYYTHTTMGNILYFSSQLLFSFLYMYLMVFNEKIETLKKEKTNT